MDKKRFLKKVGYLFGAFLLLLPILAFAFETKFPVIPGVPSPSDFTSFVNYLYYFLLIVGSMVSLLSLIYGGIIYFFSGGNPGKTFFAKQQIYASFTGLGILLLSFVILNFLNPNLTITRLPNVPTISGPGLAPLIPPEQRVISYWELPIGELEDDVLNKTSALIQPVDLSKPVEDLVKELENESIYLQTLLQSCKCSNLKSECDNQCSGLGCKDLLGGTADKIDLCPNLGEIQAQENKIKAVQVRLKTAWKPLLIASIDAKIAMVKLIAARSLLKECLPSPMDLKTFLGIQDMEGIEKKEFFDDTSSKKHPLTFYCDLDEDLVLHMSENMGMAIYQLELERDRDIDDSITTPGTPPGPPENPHIGVTKTPVPSGPFQNSQLPFSAEYRITITAKQQKLTNIQFQYECKVSKEGSSIPCPNLNPSIPTPPVEISPGNPFTFSYRQIYTTGFQNSLVIDTIKVKATPAGVSNQTGIASVSIAIGSPPTGCFVFDQSWSANPTYKADLESAIAFLVSSYPTYASKVCSGGTLELRYNPAGLYNYWGYYHGTWIEFFPLGAANARYILIHEACHALVDRISSLWPQYTSYPGIFNETPRCFYSYGADLYEERLCEAVTFYAIPCSRNANFNLTYPIHYQFVKNHVYQ
ncbi:hypothetical protein L6250_03420 [Candidatus Parcubacteria bacterium]|nr:hypothetical protein [Patescibacteria group bacterium]MBU4466562.1 hypothetical protein [Patescibacteria group bacterium]MCG2688655.1 hypothetical protein [Candidatus Parcubacteria bacterium]